MLICWCRYFKVLRRWNSDSLVFMASIPCHGSYIDALVLSHVQRVWITLQYRKRAIWPLRKHIYNNRWKYGLCLQISLDSNLISYHLPELESHLSPYFFINKVKIITSWWTDVRAKWQNTLQMYLIHHQRHNFHWIHWSSASSCNCS